MTIYKYLPQSRIDIIENQSIRCTPAINQNDIFEMRPYFNKIIDPSQTDKLFSGIELDTNKIINDVFMQLPENISEKLNKEKIRQNFEKFLNTADGELFFEGLKNDTIKVMNHLTPQFQSKVQQTLTKLVGIISFSEVNNNNLMWAHYGEEHKGFIIGFNENHQFFNRPRTQDDELYRIRQVTYDKLDKIDVLYGSQGIDFLYRKRAEWKYEQEWRIMFLLSDADKIYKKNGDDIHLFKYPSDCMKSIIFGVKSNNSFKKRVLGILKSEIFKHIKIGQMDIDEYTPILKVKWLNEKN